ncbi:MAG: tyrosine-type recombinase/integrase, partial [Gammaproteobacteria bacterium]|nr:tyrosine-type recombinase/integrase [Gammaproteobacteria bacterium]
HTPRERPRDPRPTASAAGLSDTPYVFVTERKGSLTTSAVRKIIARAGEKASISFPVHPHMLRHGCGFKLANEGHDTRAIQHYMGHKNIQHTVRYTELAAGRFNGFWKD